MNLTTAMGLVLRELTVSDAPTYYRVLDRNRAHLGRYGDYPQEVNATQVWATDHLSHPVPDRFGIWLGEQLIGRVDLVHAEPPKYGLGYWLSHDATGRGHAITACAALIDYARSRRGATDIFAGVTHGNHRSVNLLQRLGFRAVAEFETYTRFHRWLDPAEPSLSGKLLHDRDGRVDLAEHEGTDPEMCP